MGRLRLLPMAHLGRHGGRSNHRLEHPRLASRAGVHPDTVRMDWLADKNNIIGNVQLPAVCVMNNLHDMRAAIDEAMRLDPEIAAEIAAAPEPVGVG